MFYLIVNSPFQFDGRDYHKGEMVIDEAKVDAIMNGENRHQVVRSLMADEHKSGDFFRTDFELANKSKNHDVFGESTHE